MALAAGSAIQSSSGKRRVAIMADETKSAPDNPTKIGIYYQRSRHYRTIHADGAQLGVTPRAAIQFTLFTDQRPMPEFVLHQINPDGNLGEVIEEAKKEGVIREVEANVVMDVATATSFVEKLQGVLEQIKSLQAKAQQAEPQAPAVISGTE
jgi:hypothetical protein